MLNKTKPCFILERGLKSQNQGLLRVTSTTSHGSLCTGHPLLPVCNYLHFTQAIVIPTANQNWVFSFYVANEKPNSLEVPFAHWCRVWAVCSPLAWHSRLSSAHSCPKALQRWSFSLKDTFSDVAKPSGIWQKQLKFWWLGTAYTAFHLWMHRILQCNYKIKSPLLLRCASRICPWL